MQGAPVEAPCRGIQCAVGNRSHRSESRWGTTSLAVTWLTRVPLAIGCHVFIRTDEKSTLPYCQGNDRTSDGRLAFELGVMAGRMAMKRGQGRWWETVCVSEGSWLS